MRWIWIDKFVEFESGRRARAIKNVTLAEDHLHDHFPGYPVMPHSLVTEGCAQTGGLLVGEAIHFREMVVLAKLSRATYHFPATASDQLVYTATIEDLKDDGAIVTATSEINGRLQAEMEIVYAFLRDRAQIGAGSLDAKNFVAMMKALGVLDCVGAADALPEGLARLRSLAEG